MKVYKVIGILILICLLFLIWWPIWAMFIGSFFSLDEINAYVAPVFSKGNGFAMWPFLPAYPTLRPFIEIFLDSPEFFTMFWNSCSMVFPQILGQVLVGAPMAWAISVLKVKGSNVIYAIYTILMILPFQVTMLPSYLVMNRLDYLDTIWSVVLPGIFSAFPVFIMVNSFKGIPKDLIESAGIDGAGEFRIFLRLGLPLGSPGVISAVLLGFLEAWSMIEQPMTFIKDKSLWPLSLYISNMSATDIGSAMVASFMTMAPAILIFFFGQKYLEGGIQASGMKE